MDIFSLPSSPVVVGSWQGLMHSHSHSMTTLSWSHPAHTFTYIYHIQPKKAFEPSTIRTVFNDCSDVHAVVVWIVSGMKELLHFPKQLLPVAIHQSVSTCLLILHVKEALTAIDVHVTFSLHVICHASEVQQRWIAGDESLYSWIIHFCSLNELSYRHWTCLQRLPKCLHQMSASGPQ